MRRVLVVWAVLGLLAVAAVAAPPGYHVIYQNGLSRRVADAKLQADEARAKEGGHQPWRTSALFVASVDGAGLLPKRQREYGGTMAAKRIDGREAMVGKRVTWVLLGQKQDTAAARVLLRGRPYGEVKLIRPFGYWWYVSAAHRLRAGHSPRAGASRRHGRAPARAGHHRRPGQPAHR